MEVTAFVAVRCRFKASLTVPFSLFAVTLTAASCTSAEASEISSSIDPFAGTMMPVPVFGP